MKSFQQYIFEQNSSNLINQITYGNPPLEIFELAQKADDPIKNWFIKNNLVEKMKMEAPANDSEVTRRDIQILLEMMSNATAEEVTFSRYTDSIDNLAQSFIDLLAEHGHEEDMGGFFRIDSQTEPILHFLKDVIDRPRPYQLAKAFNVPLYPLMRTDAMTAAYPSGHALAGFVMAEYYARKFPDVANEARELGEKIARSREVVGIHFPSDTQISREISNIIWENNLILD
jgi:acid phosphatase (class A)